MQYYVMYGRHTLYVLNDYPCRTFNATVWIKVDSGISQTIKLQIQIIYLRNTMKQFGVCDKVTEYMI